ncbi:MAG: hypothetical protein COA88_09190 [Kordia sp.]|nr:MAG: hypothetical protein COA88_09190 [Kordia sp.]
MKLLLNDFFFATYFTINSKLLLTVKSLISIPSFLSIAYLNGMIEGYFRPIIYISFAFFLYQLM